MTTTNTTTNTTADTVRKMPAATLKALQSRADALKVAESTATTSVQDAEWSGFNLTTDALVSLGAFVSESIAPKMGDATVNGENIRKAFAEKASGLYVADADARKALPSASTFSRAIDLARLDTTAHRDAFKASGNAPKMQDYVLWSKLAVGESLSGKSTVDVDKTVTVAGKGKTQTRTVGKLVRKPSTARTTTAPTAATVVGFFSDLLSMSGEELDAVVADGPTDVSAIPESVRRDVARQIMASIVRSELSEKIVVPIG